MDDASGMMRALSGLPVMERTTTQGGGQARGARLPLPWAITARPFGANVSMDN